MISIRKRLMGGYALLTGFIIIQAGIAFHYLDQSEALISRAVQQDFGNSLVLARIANDGEKLQRLEKEVFLHITDRDKLQSYRDLWQETFRSLRQQVNAINGDKTQHWTAADRVEGKSWESALDDYELGFNLVMDQIETRKLKDTLSANLAIRASNEKFEPLLRGASLRMRAGHQRAQQSADEIRSNFEVVYMVLSTILGGGIVLALALTVLVPRSIARPLKDLTDAAEAMSTGKLDTVVPRSNGIELAALADVLERMRISQKTLMDRLRSS